MTNSVYTLDKKRTALIKQNFGVPRQNSPHVDKLKHAKVVQTKITLQITNGDHFANNQSEVRQNSEKDYKTIRHGTASHRIESFAIAILDTLIDCEFPLDYAFFDGFFHS